MENLLISVRCVTPMFLTLCLGIWLRSRKIVPDEFFNKLSTLCFHGLLPFQLFYNIYDAQIDSSFPISLMVFLEAGLLIWFGTNYAVFSKAEPDHKVRGAYIQNAFRTNIAVVGTSLAQSMMGAPGITSVSVATAILVPTFNVLAVITLETCRGGNVSASETVRMIIKNPLIRACLLGLLFMLLGIRFPQPIDHALQSFGTTGSTMTLVALGGSLRFGATKRNAKRLVFCNLYRLLAAPLVMLTSAVLIGFRGDALGTVLICAATPLAASAHPMAIACQSDYELTGQIVVTTTLLCCLSMFIWIFALKQSGLL